MTKALRRKRSARRKRLPVDDIPADAASFVRQGGIRRREADAGAKAAAEAMEAERRYWLPKLERWLKQGENPVGPYSLASDIKRIRRALGLPPQVRRVRELTRLRVRAYRQRQR